MTFFDRAPRRAITQRHRPRITLWPTGRTSRRIDLGPMCVSFQVNKAVHAPMGSWTVTLLPRQGSKGGTNIMRQADIIKEVRPNGVISIGMDEPGGIMLGLIDEPAQVRQFGNRGSMGITLRGSDFGKTLAREHIIKAQLQNADSTLFRDKIGLVTGQKSSILADIQGIWGLEHGEGDRAVSTFTFATVQDVVDWLLTTVPSMTVPLLASWGGTGRPGEYIKTSSSITTWNNGEIPDEAPHSFTGTVWDFIRSILDEDFYEAWLDTTPKPRKPSEIPDIELIIRPKPFDEPALDFLPVDRSTIGISWDSLTTRIDGLKHHEIGLEQVLRMNLGHTDADVFAFYLASGAHNLLGNPDGHKEGVFFPAVDTYALKRSGLRAYQASLSLIGEDVARKQKGDEDYTAEVVLQVVEARNRLFNWYRLNEYFEAGAILVPGRDRYRAGDPVFLPWYSPARRFVGQTPEKGTRFYAPGVVHSWNLGGLYTTQFQLMRGHNRKLIDHAKLDIFADAPLGNISHLVAANR